MEVIRKNNVDFRADPESNTNIPHQSNISKLALCAHNFELTNCLELLAGKGLHGDTAIFVLSAFIEVMGVGE